MVGIVLAGGYSSRAKVNKLLLEVDRKPLICHTIDTIKPFVKKVFVVTGRFHDDLVPVLKRKGVEIVRNEEFEKGMFSSVLAGARAAIGDDVLLLPGDITNVQSSTFEAILKGKKGIRVPSSNGSMGHPVFISKELVELLTNEPIGSTLYDFIHAYMSEREIIEVDDSYIDFDVDTIDDYNRLIELIRKEITL